MKKAVIIVVGILLLLVVGALAAPSFIDWNQYKPEIIQAAKEATGRDLAIDGDLTLSVLPTPTLAVQAVRLANIDGAKDADMIRLASLDVEVALRPLLSGRIKVQRIRLVEPRILLEVLEDGRANWQLSPPSDAAKGESSAGDSPTSSATTSGNGFDLSLEDIAIEGAILIYRDHRTGTEERLENLSLEGSAVTLNGPFAALGQAQARGIPLSFDMRIGALDSGRPVPLRYN